MVIITTSNWFWSIYSENNGIYRKEAVMIDYKKVLELCLPAKVEQVDIRDLSR